MTKAILLKFMFSKKVTNIDEQKDDIKSLYTFQTLETFIRLIFRNDFKQN